jgi:N-acetylneuraminic acid mutarotase
MRDTPSNTKIAGANAGWRLQFAGKSPVVRCHWPGVARLLRREVRLPGIHLHATGLAMGMWLASAAAGFGQPVAPSGLSAATSSATEIDLMWNDNSANEQGFRIERSLDGIAFSQIDATTSNVTAYASTNLSPAIKYYFRVRAFNGAGNSPYSNTNTATTRTPLAQWRLSKFSPSDLTNAAVSGLQADPDGDGLANIVEYAWNREPSSPDAGGLSVAGIERINTDDFLAVTYGHNADAIDIEFTARLSDDLVAWRTNGVTGPIPISTNAGTITEKFRATTPMGSAPQQFMQMAVSYTGVRNSWESGQSLPLLFVEMSCAWLGDKLYATGMTNAFNPAPTSPTFVYDIVSNSWTRLNPDRPFTGNHHAAEVLGGRLYLIGGCDAGSDGKVQIYDPATNGWSLGAPMPFAAGACASAVINGKIYAAGGIVGQIAGSNIGYNTNAAAAYDPALNAWTLLAPIPVGMNHTASATDGAKLYLFGGRAIGNAPDNGYNTVQIYDPASNSWVSSSDTGSTLAPLPQARGGMGKAIFYNGDFYIMGGETVNGSGATANHVYNRVDIYNVASNNWRLGTPMPTARHGICPALRGNRVYVAGGGVVSGVSYSASLEIYILL